MNTTVWVKPQIPILMFLTESTFEQIICFNMQLLLIKKQFHKLFSVINGGKSEVDIMLSL